MTQAVNAPDLEPGEELTLAWWICDGGPTLEQAHGALTLEIARYFAQRKWAHSPIKYTIIEADSPFLAAKPPAKMQGRNPRVVLATVYAIAPMSDPGRGMTADMPEEQLLKLRGIVRREWAKNNDGERLDDAACDAMIERLMPETVRHVVH